MSTLQTSLAATCQEHFLASSGRTHYDFLSVQTDTVGDNYDSSSLPTVGLATGEMPAGLSYSLFHGLYGHRPGRWSVQRSSGTEVMCNHIISSGCMAASFEGGVVDT